jgi:hypothetical protein
VEVKVKMDKEGLRVLGIWTDGSPGGKEEQEGAGHENGVSHRGVYPVQTLEDGVDQEGRGEAKGQNVHGGCRQDGGDAFETMFCGNHSRRMTKPVKEGNMEMEMRIGMNTPTDHSTRIANQRLEEHSTTQNSDVATLAAARRMRMSCE